MWWTSPLEDENGNLIMVTGRGDIDKFRSNPKFKIGVAVTNPNNGIPIGTPTDEEADQLQATADSFDTVLKADPVAVLTGIYTGAGERQMVFYTLSTNIFNKKLNLALEPFPLLPLTITAENDPDWEEYDEMRSLSEIN